MTSKSIDLISAGHICLDVTPEFPDVQSERPFERLLRPGSLTVVGPATVSTGGAAAHVGLSAQKLGLSVALMGKCGGDLLGQTLLAALQRVSPQCASGMRIASGKVFQIADDPMREMDVTIARAFAPTEHRLPKDATWGFAPASVSAVELHVEECRP